MEEEGRRGLKMQHWPRKIMTNTSIKKTSCYSSQPQHIQLTNTHQHQVSIFHQKNNTYAFKNRRRERAHRQRLWWAKSVLLEVMKDKMQQHTREHVSRRKKTRASDSTDMLLFVPSHPSLSSHLPISISSVLLYTVVTIMVNMKCLKKCVESKTWSIQKLNNTTMPH